MLQYFSYEKFAMDTLAEHILKGEAVLEASEPYGRASIILIKT